MIVGPYSYLEKTSESFPLFMIIVTTTAVQIKSHLSSFPWIGSFPLKHLNPSKLQTGVTLEYTPNITDIFNNKFYPQTWQYFSLHVVLL